MNASKQIPELQSYAEIGEFWDTHSLADYWDETEPAEFEISPMARQRYLISVDSNLLMRAQRVAHRRGVSTEILINLLLEQRLHELELQPA